MGARNISDILEDSSKIFFSKALQDIKKSKKFTSFLKKI